MPLREARCSACSTTTTWLEPKEAAPVACACGGEMAPILSAPARGLVTGTATPGGIVAGTPRSEGFRVLEETAGFIVRQKGDDMGIIVEWQCEDGHRDFDIMDAQPTETPPCATCGKTTAIIAGVPSMDWFTAAGFHATGGYQCDGLGEWVKSPAHRKELMAKYGVREGDEDSSALLRQAEKKVIEDAQDREVWEMLHTKVDDSPEMRKMRAEGLVPDEAWAIEDLAKKHGWA